MILCLHYHPLKNKSENVFYVKPLRPEKQLQYKFASREHLKLTGIIVEIVVVIIGRIIVWKQAMSSGRILPFIKEF